MNRLAKILKISLLLLVFLYFPISITFAADSDNASSFGNLLISIIDLLTSIWFVFPIILGKLLTNDLVYGSVIHLDTMLWQVWNFSRSLANFTIGFMFIYFIFRFIVGFSQNDFSLVKTNLPKIALGAIVINASWFILGVLIDISTILIAGFGSLPLKFYNEDSLQKIENIALPKEIVLSQDNCTTADKDKCFFPGSLNIQVIEQQEKPYKDFQSYGMSVSGPLFFLGSSIIGSNEKGKLLNDAFDMDQNRLKSGGPAVRALVKLIIIVLFTIPMLILIVINIVRIFWVWMYICFSPLIFLDQIFGGKVASRGAAKAFSFKNMIGLIFQPALVVLAFSISCIFFVGIYDALKQDEGGDGYKESVKKIFLLDDGDNGIISVDLGEQQDANSVGFIGGFFSYLLISAVVIFVLWGLIKLSFQSTEITKGIANSAFKFTEDIVKSANIIPTPIGRISLGAMKKFGQNVSAMPDIVSNKQRDRLVSAFSSNAGGSDIDSNKADRIISDLTSASDPARRTAVSDAITSLQHIKSKNVTGDGHKRLIDALESYAQSKNLSFKDELATAPDYNKKLEIILANSSSFGV